jgi:hypothetical protein
MANPSSFCGRLHADQEERKATALEDSIHRKIAKEKHLFIVPDLPWSRRDARDPNLLQNRDRSQGLGNCTQSTCVALWTAVLAVQTRHCAAEDSPDKYYVHFRRGLWASRSPLQLLCGWQHGPPANGVADLQRFTPRIYLPYHGSPSVTFSFGSTVEIFNTLLLIRLLNHFILFLFSFLMRVFEAFARVTFND